MTMVEGVSGLMNVGPERSRPHFFSSLRELRWANGSVAQIFSSEDPDGMRGPQYHAAWADESCSRLRALLGAKRRRKPCEPAIDFADPGFCRVFALACGVWAGEVVDPTRGATLAHRHDEAPAWTERARGTALIGPWMFYRPR